MQVRSKLGERPSAVAAYREAYKLAEADIGVLKGFAEALVANARQAEAVRVVQVCLLFIAFTGVHDVDCLKCFLFSFLKQGWHALSGSIG